MSAFAYRASVRSAPKRRSASFVVVVLAYVAGFFGALPALLWTIGTRLDRVLALPSFAGIAANVAGAALIAGGVAWMVWSMASLSLRGRGLPISHLPPATLVERGPHAFVRHPIYVGYACAFAGLGIATGSIGRGILAAALLYAGSIIYALAFEEPRLRARFGPAYLAFAARVPSFPLASLITRVVLAIWTPVRRPVERLANRVVLFRVGPAVFVTYGAFASVGAGISLASLSALLGDTLGAREEVAYLAGIALWILACARVVALLYRARLLLAKPAEALRTVGFVSWGGYIGAFTFPFAFAFVTGHDGAWLLERTFVVALVCSAFGRVGCLTYGCCYGSRSKHGVAWTCPDAKPHRELDDRHVAEAPRLPTQLLSAAAVLVTVPLVVAVANRAAPGAATAIGALFYATVRFAIECRRDEPRFTRLGLTRGQLFALAGGAIAVAALLVGSFERAPAPLALAGPLSEAAWMASAASAVVTFFVCGLHWRRVGRW